MYHSVIMKYTLAECAIPELLQNAQAIIEWYEQVENARSTVDEFAESL